MEYLKGVRDEEPEGCVFCALLDAPDAGAGKSTSERILARSDLAFVTLAKYPYNPGHLLVLPVRHCGAIEDLSVAENAAIIELIQRGVGALKAESDPHGFNVGLNLGRAAGAGIPEHLHWHVVPRWGGDTNFMPVVGETRVLPELLADAYRRLKPRFE